MADHSGRSVQQLKAETERTRAGLTDTVEQLRASVTETATEVRQRISPAAIKAEVSGYIQNRREQLMEDITSAARDNPMQAIAVGAAIGYPLLKIARSIPLPILMIGAGLFFTSTKKGQALAHDARDYATDFTDKTMRRAQEFGDQVTETVQGVVGQGVDATERVKEAALEGVGRLSDTVSSAQSAAKAWAHGNGGSASDGVNPYSPTGRESEFSPGMSSRAGSYAGQSGGGFRDAGAGIRQSATDAFESVSRTASSALDSGMEAARSARESAYYAARRANRTIGNTVQSNPLVFAGLGLVAGALIASSLPRTQIEDKYVGPSRDALKQRAKEAATDQYEAVKGTASEITKSKIHKLCCN